jgi:Cd2+/Zn2+-exporting ATPase
MRDSSWGAWEGTRRIVLENIALALVAKGVLIVLLSIGVANMRKAVIGDVGVSRLAVINAMRATGKAGQRNKDVAEGPA